MVTSYPMKYSYGLIGHLLSCYHFTKDDTLCIINKLDPNKACRLKKTSICMLKTRSDSIARPLNLICKTCLYKGRFSVEYKKVN